MEKSGDVTMPLVKYEELLTKNVNLLNDNLQMSHKIEELINNDGQKVIVVEEYDDDTFISFIGFDEIKDKVEEEFKRRYVDMEGVIEDLETQINVLCEKLEKLENRTLWQRIRNKQD